MPDRWEQTGVPGWINPLELGTDLPEWVTRTGHADAALNPDEDGHHLPPLVIWRTLLGFSGLKPVPRSVGLWLATYVGGQHKSAKAGWVRGNRLHAFPKAAHIAKRSGFAERTVRESLLTLERAGWVYIERHRIAPSDYWIALPEVELCPCGCEAASGTRVGSSAAGAAGQGAGAAGPSGRSCRTDRQELPPHLVHALGSSKGSSHSRSASPSDGVDNLEENGTGNPEPEVVDQGEDFTGYVLDESQRRVEGDGVVSTTDDGRVMGDPYEGFREVTREELFNVGAEADRLLAFLALVNTKQDQDNALTAWTRSLEAQDWPADLIAAARLTARDKAREQVA